MNRISAHISYGEATRSQVAVRHNMLNLPDAKQLEAMRLVAERVFEPVRRQFGVPLMVSSFFRTKQVNALTGGSETSQHCKGEALDIDHDTLNAKIFEYIRTNLNFDQLIWEFGTDKEPAWVHISYRATGNRKEVLRAFKNGYRTVYKKMV